MALDSSMSPPCASMSARTWGHFVPSRTIGGRRAVIRCAILPHHRVYRSVHAVPRLNALAGDDCRGKPNPALRTCAVECCDRYVASCEYASSISTTHSKSYAAATRRACAAPCACPQAESSSPTHSPVPRRVRYSAHTVLLSDSLHLGLSPPRWRSRYYGLRWRLTAHRCCRRPCRHCSFLRRLTPLRPFPVREASRGKTNIFRLAYPPHLRPQLLCSHRASARLVTLSATSASYGS